MAIKSTDLRRGNLITANGPAMELNSIFEDHVELYLHGSEADNWDEDLEVCKGIPITEELLEKISPKNEDGWHYVSKTLRVCCAEVTGLCNVSMGMMETGSDEIDWFIISLPEYLHQFQNLVHSLTGEELPIKNL